ncbi:MAG: DUF3368 domain-containing protein [Limisphaerales bacterium]
MIVVSDTSSISALLRIGHVALLPRLYGEALIPEIVRDELPDFFPKNERLIASIRPLIEQLEKKTNFRLSDELKQDTLRLANEL